MLKNCPWKKYHIGCKNDCMKQKGDDRQKQRVYCWEETLNHDLGESQKPMTFKGCKDLVKKICDRYKVKVPVVIDGFLRRKAQGGVDRISLPNKYRDRIAVIHEVCHTLEHNHAIKYSTYDSREHHGDVFMRFVIDNFSRELKIPIKRLINSTKAFNLEIAERKKSELSNEK